MLMLDLAKKLLWRIAAVVFLTFGIVGIFLPVLPTVPFVLAAAWCASKGWPALERWLLNHPQFGQSIRNWRNHGMVNRRAKWLATLTMAGSALLLQFLPLPLWAEPARLVVPLILLLVCLWLWQRPEPQPQTEAAKS